MGFGFVFIGYLFLCSFSVGSEATSAAVDIFPDIIGWIFMFLGLRLLSTWSDRLKAAKVISVVMMPVSLYFLLYNLQLLGFFGGAADTLASVLEYLQIALMLVYHYFLLFGVREIALSTGSEQKLADKCRRNFFFVVGYYLMNLLSQVVNRFHLLADKDLLASLNICTTILGAVSLLLCAFALLSAYMHIVLGDK